MEERAIAGPGLKQSPRPISAVRRLDRNIAITGSVVLFHVAALWALHTGLLRRAVEIVVPVVMMSEFVARPDRQPEPQPRPQPPEPVKQPVVKRLQAPPQPVALPSPQPSANAPTGIAEPLPPVATVSLPAAPIAPAAPAKLELPSSEADYLQNPKPAYPPLSKRLGEQGKVVLRVLIGADGTPQKAELLKSSGFERLDQAAQATVLKWRFVPGKRGGVAEAAWAQVPINFVLE